MSKEKIHFYLKQNPPRPSFMTGMSDEESAITQSHVSYWATYINDGTVIVLRPLMDPKGGYGVAVVAVEGEVQLTR